MSRCRFKRTAFVLAAALTFLPPPAAAWYVAPTGDDAWDCLSAATPCLTINGALDKASGGDTILVAGGTYTAPAGAEVVSVGKAVTLSGGWDPTFAAQSETSIIDGGGARRGVTVGSAIEATIDSFTIRHGFHENQGGGVRNNGTLTISNCTITQNASQWMGGGIFSLGTLTVNDTTISDNSAGHTGYSGGGGGGGIQVYGGTAVFNGCTVSGNVILGSFSGSGINTFGATTLNNSTVSGNSGGSGDGIYTFVGAVALNNSTITGSQSAGVRNLGGEVTLQNSILAANGAGGDCLNNSGYSGVVVSGGFNLVGDGTGSTLTPATGDQIGTSASPIDPHLGPLQNHGGPTATHPLLSGSPALEAGNPAVPGSGDGACLATDQRGIPRPVGSLCDIGAFEGYVTTVASIVRLDPNPTSSPVVDFAVTFSDPVTGVDTTAPFSDFALATTGVTGAAIAGVSGAGDTYTVSVDPGSGDGTVRLDVVDDDSILNGGGVPLGGAGAGNGDFSGGEVYTIWGTPRVLSILRADADPTGEPAVHFSVSFSEPVTGVDAAPPFGDFSLTTTGATTGTVTSVEGSGATYTVAVSVDPHGGNGTLRLDVVDDDSIIDAGGSPLGGPGPGNGDYDAGETYTILTIPSPLAPAGRISSSRPRFSWTTVPGATAYNLQLRRAGRLVASARVAAADCGATDCSGKLKASLRPSAYQWRVRARRGGAWGSYSAHRRFSVAPRAGFWSGPGVTFSVSPTLDRVLNFAIFVSVSGCGNYKITHIRPERIAKGRFAFTGPFYASGRFSTVSRVAGKLGLSSFPIPGCGYVSGGPFSWSGRWGSPPAAVSATVDEPVPEVEALQSLAEGFFSAEASEE